MKIVWGIVGVACLGFAAFHAYLNLTRDQIIPAGFAYTAGIALAGIYALTRLRSKRSSPD